VLRSTAADVDSTGLCPIVAFDERLELLAFVLAAAHRMGVDAQRESPSALANEVVAGGVASGRFEGGLHGRCR